MPGDRDVAHVAHVAHAEPSSRDERRRRSEQAILDAARVAFAELGFERTTIRAVATGAGVDPALVMQYFGSKEQLFAAAARWDPGEESVLHASAGDVPAAAITDLLQRFEGGDREATVALMRSCLTHPVAMQVMRDEVMCERAAAVAAALPGEEAELRAGLIGACMIGLGMARYLLEIEPVASASQDDLLRLFAPALAALASPPASP